MTRKEILAAAEKCVCGDREQDYGIPENSFRLIAEFWHTYLSAKCVAAGVHVQLEPEDVAAMMALLKIARASVTPEHIDSWIDGAGYLACGGELATLGEKDCVSTEECLPAQRISGKHRKHFLTNSMKSFVLREPPRPGWLIFNRK